MSGSLLRVELKGIASASVGYLTVLKMYSLDFEEFMIANNVSNVTLDMLKERFEMCIPIDDFIHQRLLTMFFIYLIVGGMPDAVKTYIETKDNITYLPIYLCYLLKEKKLEKMIIDLDLSGL